MDARPSAERVSSRLVLFAPGSSPERRRRRLVFVVVAAVAAAMIVWPLYPLVAGPFPLILGLPFSLAWVVLALAVMFGNLVRLYLADARDEIRTEKDGRGPDSSGEGS